MKKMLLFFSVIVVFFISNNLYSLENFTYKSIALDNSGQLIPNSIIDITISIIKGDSVIYKETHSNVSTDQFSAFSIEVGSGHVLKGEFERIDVTANTRIKIEINGEENSIVTEVRPLTDLLNSISNSFWALDGNNGTTPGTNFVGTGDDNPLHVAVKNGDAVSNSLILNNNASIGREMQGSIAGADRGTNAVDWQIYREDKEQIASGKSSTISGGGKNTAGGDHSTVSGGESNTANGDYSTIAGGLKNTAKSKYVVIGGGISNYADHDYAAVLGGSGNEATGDYSTVVAGEGNNTKGDDAAVVGGRKNSAAGGFSYIGGGDGNSAEGKYTTVSGGYGNYAKGEYSFIAGGRSGYTDKYGQFTQSSGGFHTNGDAQTSVFVARKTTDGHGGASFMYLDGDSERESITIPDKSTWTFQIMVVGASKSDDDYASYILKGMIRRRGTNVYVSGLKTEKLVETSHIHAPKIETKDYALRIVVQSEKDIEVRWVARVEIVEVKW